jgi:hypothetical protein
VAWDASSAAADDASTTARPTCCTSVLGAPGGPSFTPLPAPPPHQQQAAAPTWSPWTGAWNQQSLANSFSTMALTPPVVTDWVTDSDASDHTTSDVGNLSSVRPSTSTDPSSIVVGNGSALPVTSVGDSALPGLFYLNNVLVTPDIIQNLLSVHRFTTDNWCSMEFDSFGLSVKDLSMQNVITRCNSLRPLYTMRLPLTSSFITCVCSFSLSCIGVYLASTSRPPWCRHPIQIIS